MIYNQKVVSWKHKQEMYKYKHPIITSDNTTKSTDISNTNKSDSGYNDINSDIIKKSRTNYEHMTAIQKEESDRRRISYYHKKIYYLTNLAIHNDLYLFGTLTFAEPINDYCTAKKKWDLFLKRLKYHTNNLKYIAVHELQKKRGDIFHFHFLCNLEYIPHNDLEKIWNNGYVYIKEIKKIEKGNFRQIEYVFKYVVKDILEDAKKGKRNKARPIYCSRNLEKPKIEKSYSTHPIEDDIFDNMECIISDGHYDVKNWCGIKINEVDYLKIKKQNI